jgi:hypothetical protein
MAASKMRMGLVVSPLLHFLRLGSRPGASRLWDSLSCAVRTVDGRCVKIVHIVGDFRYCTCRAFDENLAGPRILTELAAVRAELGAGTAPHENGAEDRWSSQKNWTAIKVKVKNFHE